MSEMYNIVADNFSPSSDQIRYKRCFHGRFIESCSECYSSDVDSDVPKFLELPQELRLIIWDLAIGGQPYLAPDGKLKH
jgi:hypothetical protein